MRWFVLKFDSYRPKTGLPTLFNLYVCYVCYRISAALYRKKSSCEPISVIWSCLSRCALGDYQLREVIRRFWASGFEFLIHRTWICMAANRAFTESWQSVHPNNSSMDATHVVCCWWWCCVVDSASDSKLVFGRVFFFFYCWWNFRLSTDGFRLLRRRRWCSV